jgi:hypothetical protein
MPKSITNAGKQKTLRASKTDKTSRAFRILFEDVRAIF